MNPLTSVSTV